MTRPPPRPQLIITVDTEPDERIDILAARVLIELSGILHAEGITATRMTIEITDPTH